MAGGACLLAIALIPIIGFILTLSGPEDKTVILVNEARYSLGDLRSILRSYQWRSQQPLDMSTLPFQIVELLTENKVISQFAPELGMSVAEEDVSADIRKTLEGEPPKDTPRAQLDRDFKENYRKMLSGTRLSEGEHRDLVRSSLLRDKVRERVSTEVASVADQFHLYALTVKSEQLAIEAATEFERGVVFQDLVTKYSTNTDTIRKGGELGWVVRGLNADLDKIADEAEPGKLSKPRNEVVQGPPGQQGVIQYTLYLVTDKVVGRELDEGHRGQLKEQALQKWISQQRAKSVIETNFGSAEYSWIVQELRKTAPPSQVPPG